MAQLGMLDAMHLPSEGWVLLDLLLFVLIDEAFLLGCFICNLLLYTFRSRHDVFE
jgi:hypothetical protein